MAAGANSRAMAAKMGNMIGFIKVYPLTSNLDRIIRFVLGIVLANQQPLEKPNCPHCGGTSVIKYGHRKGKQRFLCHDCGQTFMHSTNTLMANSHYGRSVWADFIHVLFMANPWIILRKNMGFPIRLLLICAIK